MTLASTMTRAPRLTPAPPARRAVAPGRQAPSLPQWHTVTFRGCSRCWGGCPESRSNRLRRCRPSRTWCRSRSCAWLTAEGARGQQGALGPQSPHLLTGSTNSHPARECPAVGTSRTTVLSRCPPPHLRSGPSGVWLGELTINLAEAPVLGKLWDSGTQLKVEGGPVGGQVLICGPQEKARALTWLAAHATRSEGQLRGMVIDLQDLNG